MSLTSFGAFRFLNLLSATISVFQIIDGYREIALNEAQGIGKHTAVQMSNRRCWRSRMGQRPVINCIGPESLSGGMYGDAAVCVRRAVRVTR